MLVSLLMLPAYMHYFQSNTVLGMWFTVVQLLNWIMLLDFGVGGGLRNKIIEPLKHANKNRVISLISAAYISVFAIVLMLIIFQYVLVGPRLSAFRWSVAKEVLSTGGLLFYLQIVLMLLFNVKEIYISWFIGAKEVVEYQIYYKLIGIFGGLYSLALTPVWSAITKAIVEQKYRWIERLYHRGLLTIIGFSGIQLLVLLFMPWIVKIWLGEKAIEISFGDGLIFCVYNVIYMCLALNYNFACGMEQTKGIAFWLTVAAVLNYFLNMWGCLFY